MQVAAFLCWWKLLSTERVACRASGETVPTYLAHMLAPEEQHVYSFGYVTNSRSVRSAMYKRAWYVSPDGATRYSVAPGL